MCDASSVSVGFLSFARFCSPGFFAGVQWFSSSVAAAVAEASAGVAVDWAAFGLSDPPHAVRSRARQAAATVRDLDTAGKDRCDPISGYAVWKMRGRLSARATIGAGFAVAAVVAIVAPGGASGGDDASQPYPARQLSIMAPAAAGGGWDTTARAFQSASRATKLDDGIEVFNVEGAGGTLGLSQLVSKGSGDPYQLMMTGLVMLGAIETNGSDVPLSRTTPIATLITETEAIVVPAKSKYRSFKDLVADFKRDPGSIRWAGGSAGGTDQLLVGQLARVLGADAKRTKYVAHSGGGEANAAILSGSVDAGVSGLERVHRPGRGGQDAAARGLLAGRR